MVPYISPRFIDTKKVGTHWRKSIRTEGSLCLEVIANLPEKQGEVLALRAGGLSISEIATRTYRACSTTKNLLRTAFEELGLNRTNDQALKIAAFIWGAGRAGAVQYGVPTLQYDQIANNAADIKINPKVAEVLCLVGQGYGRREVAEMRGKALPTIHHQLESFYSQIKVQTPTLFNAVMGAHALNLYEPEMYNQLTSFPGEDAKITEDVVPIPTYL